MPTYVYRNLTTGQTFELKQSMKDDALTVHPETGEPVKRLLSAPGIAFKGSGFYANDSRSSSRKSSSDSGASGSGSDSRSGDSTNESSKSEGAGSSAPAKTESSAAPSKGGSGE
jgi:putative FmdB family regulatory protein